MIDLSELSAKDDDDSTRWQIVLRITLIFGEERAAADRDEIEIAAAAIQRVRRLHPVDFSGLDPREHA
jgi:hypothetical protein